jgi:hypothetical protein
MWKTIPQFPKYEVSDDGFVRNVVTQKILKAACTANGYRSVSLGYGNSRNVSRLVAEAFIPNPENKAEVAHNDGSRTNDAVENLRWATKTENQQDRLKHGTHNRGERGAYAKFTDAQAETIRQRFLSGASRMRMSEEFSVSYCTIDAICHHKTYRAAA